MAEANENTPLLGAAGGAARQVPQTLFKLQCFCFFVLFSASSGFFQLSFSFCFPCRDSKWGLSFVQLKKTMSRLPNKESSFLFNYFLIEAAFLI